MSEKPLNYFKAMQVLSMKAVLQPDGEYLLRRIYRYYSTHFHTPLADVEKLPLETVLINYYEHVYENMEEGNRENIRARLAMTDEEIEAAKLNKEDAEEDDDEYVKQIEAEEQARLAKAAGNAAAAGKATKAKEDEWAGMDEPTAPPDVKMNFTSQKELDSILDKWDQRGT